MRHRATQVVAWLVNIPHPAHLPGNGTGELRTKKAEAGSTRLFPNLRAAMKLATNVKLCWPNRLRTSANRKQRQGRWGEGYVCRFSLDCPWLFDFPPNATLESSPRGMWWWHLDVIAVKTAGGMFRNTRNLCFSSARSIIQTGDEPVLMPGVQA